MVVNYTCKSSIELNPESHSDILSFPYLVVFCLFQKVKFKENVIPKHKRGKDFEKGRGRSFYRGSKFCCKMRKPSGQSDDIKKLSHFTSRIKPALFGGRNL